MADVVAIPVTDDTSSGGNTQNTTQSNFADAVSLHSPTTLAENESDAISGLSTNSRNSVSTSSASGNDNTPRRPSPQTSPRRESSTRVRATTVKGAGLEELDDGTVVSVPRGNKRRILGIAADDTDRDDRGYDSDGQLGPFFDAVNDEGVDDAILDVPDTMIAASEIALPNNELPPLPPQAPPSPPVPPSPPTPPVPPSPLQ